MTVSLGIVIPAFNEHGTIVEAVQSLLQTEWGFPVQIVVVNDGSTDGTGERLLAAGFDHAVVRVVDMPCRSGRGAAIRRGAALVDGSLLAFFDADLEYAPTDLARLIGFITDGDADAVFGSRYLGPARAVVQYWRSFGQRLVTLWSNALTNLNLTDATTSALVVRRAVWDKLVLQADGHDIDVEILAALARAQVRIWEVPIEYAARRRMEGRKSRRRDVGYRLLRALRSRWRGDRLLQGTTT